MIWWTRACQGKLSRDLKNFLTSPVFVYLDVCEQELESEELRCTPSLMLLRRRTVELHIQGIYTRMELSHVVL